MPSSDRPSGPSVVPVFDVGYKTPESTVGAPVISVLARTHPMRTVGSAKSASGDATMSSNLMGKSSERLSDELPLAENHPLSDNRDNDSQTTTRSNINSVRTGDRVECLDGLRGIACIVVFNYHFFWPWTKSIMLGHGFLALVTLEPYQNWLSLPIICLLHRGRPMVAIFFAISGYVLSRHIIRSIHDRKWETVYRSLSSSVFRRVFRLYIPPTISMLLVAILALTGAFPSEESVYTGPDSIYINGTYDIVRPGSCDVSSIFLTVDGIQELTRYLDLPSPEHLGNSSILSGATCLSRVSWNLGPTQLYRQMEPFEARALEVEAAKKNSTYLRLGSLSPAQIKIKDYKISIAKDIELLSKSEARRFNGSLLYWSEFGGNWEEHPYIPNNITYAITDFVRTYAEWANPFNFNNYHIRYDPHTYTMPIEFRGSMSVYLFLLGTLGLKTIWRLCLAGAISAYSLLIGRWDMSIFLGATMLSDIDIWNSSHFAAATIDYNIRKHMSKLHMSRP
ncbi:hypothetical protein E4U42_002180 [Claviceps africana]|uniref:Acyltransferase 3 domain-containing protein n=1 Tax=Claviceps africana TaxID=83212 RepID=A0A8K0J924_9HYPO|nr:hypothetical protein E4U42_002180 [Claviceps africana]